MNQKSFEPKIDWIKFHQNDTFQFFTQEFQFSSLCSGFIFCQQLVNNRIRIVERRKFRPLQWKLVITKFVKQDLTVLRFSFRTKTIGFKKSIKTFIAIRTGEGEKYPSYLII